MSAITDKIEKLQAEILDLQIEESAKGYESVGEYFEAKEYDELQDFPNRTLGEIFDDKLSMYMNEY